MMYNVTDIEFDLTDDYGEDSNLSFDDEIALLDGALGVWEADNEEDLIEEITSTFGWCIRNIHYEIQLKQCHNTYIIFQKNRLIL